MINVSNISYSIGNKNLLNQVSFSVEPGKFVAIVGANGAGKSTLLNVISGIENNYVGEVTYLNRAVCEIEKSQLSKLRAFLPQQTHLTFDFTVYQVVEMGRYWVNDKLNAQFSEKAIQYALEITGLLELKNRLYTKLSGGEKQRVQIARVLAQVYNEPFSNKILLLDEPLNNLDLKHQHQIMELCKKLAQNGNIVISVIHDLNTAAQFCDEILLLSAGKLISQGPPKQVFNQAILTEAYQFPVSVYQPAGHKNPFVIFGKSQMVNQSALIHQTNL